MKTHLFYIAVIILLLATRNCGNKNIETITTKPIKGSFKYDTVIKRIPIAKIIYRTVQASNNPDTIKNNAINDSLLKNDLKQVLSFQASNDSIKLERFKELTTPYDFKKTFEDSIVKVNIFGKYSGQLHGVGMDYVIKPRTVTVPKKWMVLGGIEATTNNTVNGKLFYYSKSGVMYFGGYGLDGTIGVGVGRKLFGN